jgi:YVTN family beta-propeller protein
MSSLARNLSCWLTLAALPVLGGCGASRGDAAAVRASAHSSSLALSADGRELFVVNPDADSVSVIDTANRKLEREILLAGAEPMADPESNDFSPVVMPRALALSPDGKTLYVTGERSASLYVIDTGSRKIRQSVTVGSEPVGVVVAPDGGAIFVACSQDDSVVRIDGATLTVTATAHVASEPRALGFSADGAALYVTQFMGPGLTELDPKTLNLAASWDVPDTAPRGNPSLAHGQVRGLYDVAQRPGTAEVWVAHALLGTDTAQPTLDFQSTAFPALSLFRAGAYAQTISTDAPSVPGIDGSFADVVSGPQAIAFTSDGEYLLMLDANSEDILVIDAKQRVETALVRPLPGKMPDGIVLSADEEWAYVHERNTSDVAVLRLDRSSGTLQVTPDAAPISVLTTDPMPADLRLGQLLFNSANSAEYAVTTDHWIACATCHMEGRSDSVTWKFAQGPRDTPSNAGGMLGTGFLFRTADRTKIQDYWHTINVEQGGRFDPTLQGSLLDALASYVNHALPLPIPPTTDPALVSAGAQVFASSGCGACHSGARFTDSGAGNPTLDLNGTVLLHDVGTCVTAGDFPDVDHEDVAGDARAACAFDTPSLSGLAASPPYLHDGSAATLQDAIAKMPNAPTSQGDIDALAEYLRSL